MRAPRLSPLVRFFLLCLISSCGSGQIGETVEVDGRAGDTGKDRGRGPLDTSPEVTDSKPGQDTDVPEPDPCTPPNAEAWCPCEDNGDCASGKCLFHMGDLTCTVPCETECPAGWACKSDGGVDPMSFCFSLYPSLCLPCDGTPGCQGTDKCFEHGDEVGAFCSPICDAGHPCPEGYSCDEMTTREGTVLFGCAPEGGECVCSDYATSNYLGTSCQKSNEWGICIGWRECGEDGLSACNAPEPAEEVCGDDVDNDCDGETDPLYLCPICYCGDGDCQWECGEGSPGEDFCPADCCVCGDGNCQTTLCNEGWTEGLKTCALDCAICSDGVCDPGEGPQACPEDCCGTCGDGVCKCQETAIEGEDGYCPDDCGQYSCGNEICEPGENPVDCLEDCEPYACGNGLCEPGENPDSCPDDCGAACGDCVCDPTESYSTCAKDCGYCGDGYCMQDCAYNAETADTCAADCGCGCDDEDPCTHNLCLADGGCLFLPKDDGAACDAPDICVGSCLAGVCTDVAVELCNGYDDDCDGEKDEDLGTTTCGLGVCEHTVDNCVAGEPVVCDPFEGQGVEVCNGLDDDCDGYEDEDLGETTCGVGECEHTVPNCAGGEPQFCDAFEGQVDEVCDGKDNDCDGDEDEDLGELSCGLGVCEHSVPVCVDGIPQVCNPFEGQEPEVCNGLDDDCDGDEDEDLGDATCGLGVCETTVPVCIDGVPNPCVQDESEKGDEVCDGKDNDCDGDEDEECDDGDECTTMDVCQDGACVGSGVLDCDDDDVCTEDSCDPGTGCQWFPVFCDDGDDCTVDSCDPVTGECQHYAPPECADECLGVADCDYDDYCDLEEGTCQPIPGEVIHHCWDEGGWGSCVTPIPDEDLVVIPMELSGADSAISAIRVKVMITHPWSGQLTVSLTHDDTMVVLHEANPGFDVDLGAVYEISDPTEPPGALDDFLGRHPEGTWSLTVEDTVAGGEGSLEYWHLYLHLVDLLDPGEPCDHPDVCVSDNCRKEISSDEHFCAEPGKDCSDQGGPGYVAGQIEDAWLCTGVDESRECDGPALCDTWVGSYCTGELSWAEGDGSGVPCLDEGAVCVGDVRFEGGACNGASGEAGACDVGGTPAAGCETETSLDAAHCDGGAWVAVGAESCCEDDEAGGGIASDPCEGKHPDCVASRICLDGPDSCEMASEGTPCGAGGSCVAAEPDWCDVEKADGEICTDDAQCASKNCDPDQLGALRCHATETACIYDDGGVYTEYAVNTGPAVCTDTGETSEDASRWVCQADQTWLDEACGDGEYCAAGGCIACQASDCATYQSCFDDSGVCCDPACDSSLEECVAVTTGGFACAAKMVEVPAGTFWMGCNNCAGSEVNDADCDSNEHPYHKVYLDAYEIDRTEVTAVQYEACVSAGGCNAAGTGGYGTYQVSGKENHPINYVDRGQVEAYCVWAGKELCTEAQWEKGARGGCEHNGGPSNCKAQSRKYPWGNAAPTCDLAVKDECDGDTQPVCSLSPAGDSPYGVCDMAGNVWEWVADWYQKDYYCDGDGATGDENCTECGSWPGSPSAWNNPYCGIGDWLRVVRGGDFLFYYGSLRVSYHSEVDPSASVFSFGGRCCRSDCGDGFCDEPGGESCSNCIQDCACPEGDVCSEGVCCTPDCVDKICGSDGCGGSCGECGDSDYCDAGLCQPLCGNGLCIDAEEDCATCPSDCGCDPSLEECVAVTTGGFACAAKMVEVPAGTFWMGCNNCAGSTVNDTFCDGDEHPYHEVYLDAYEIDRTEVTAGQYEACVSAEGCTAAGTGDYGTYQVSGKENHPINYVDRGQVEAYCVWAGKELCTEAQWEKGARGGCEHYGGPSNCKAQSRKYPWGNETPTCDLAVMGGCGGYTQPVCSLSPAGDSPYGVCDMAGNVWEWVADWYQKDYYCDGDGATGDENCTECGSWPGSPAAWSNPIGTISGPYRVERGGSFYLYDTYLRVSNRDADYPSVCTGFLGGRCCRSDCGDGFCDELGGESCSNCIQDCACTEGHVCTDGVCVPCTSDCSGKECGDDGCGGSCGVCVAACQADGDGTFSAKSDVCNQGVCEAYVACGAAYACDGAMSKDDGTVCAVVCADDDHDYCAENYACVDGACMAGLPNGESCDGNQDCCFNNCRKEINSTDYYCAAVEKECSDQGGDGYDTGDTEDPWICTGIDISNECTTGSLCDTWLDNFCDNANQWTTGDGTACICNVGEFCEADVRYANRRCNGLAGTAGACDQPGDLAFGCSDETVMDSLHCAGASWVGVGAENCCEDDGSGIGIASDPCAWKHPDCVDLRICADGPDTCTMVAEGTVCDGTGYCIASDPDWCVEGKADGEICLNDYECASKNCDPDQLDTLRCHATETACVYDDEGVYTEYATDTGPTVCANTGESADNAARWVCQADQTWLDTPCGDGEYCAAGGCIACQPSDCATYQICCCDPACDSSLEECVAVTTGGFACAAKMVEVPAGTFWMGCNNCAGSEVNDADCDSGEHPYHKVYLDAYEIDRTEVTAVQYEACVSAGGCAPAGTGSCATYQVAGKENHPINYVDWFQVESYCLWAGKELCTEAQWEKGARGGCEHNGGESNCKAQSRKYPWGNESPTCDLAVKSGCDGDTQPVCSVSPAGDSPYGLCDMAGNVWELVADWYLKDYYCDGDGANGDEYCTECGFWPGSPNAWSNPFYTLGGSYRGLRGGSFYYFDFYLRVSDRYSGPADGSDYLGGRCCRSE